MRVWAFVVVALLLALASPSLQSAIWHEIHQQSPNAAGSEAQPSIRYGHGAVVVDKQLTLVLGYYFDRDTMSPAWMADTWSMALDPPHTWRRLSEGITHNAAQSAYNAGACPDMPCGRFGHAVAVLEGAVYLYGGNDGGTSRHGKRNYEPGLEFAELWRFDASPSPAAWRLLSCGAEQALPGKRYLSAMTALAGHLLLYGGLAAGQGDVWQYDVAAATWTKLADEVPMAGGLGPGRRVGHSLFPVEGVSWQKGGTTEGFLLYGGRVIEGDASSFDADVWFFDARRHTWRRLANTTAAPPPRFYHGATHVLLPATAGPKAAGATAVPSIRGGTAAASDGAAAAFVGIVAGGSVTMPGIQCASDAWAFTVDCRLREVQWQRLHDLPTASYDLRLAGDAAAGVFTTGGHFCSASKEGNPFFYSNAVHRLDLAAAIAVPPTACRPSADPTPAQGGERSEEL